MNGQNVIIGSRVDSTSQRQYMMDVTSQGAIPISGTININNIAGSIVIGSVSANVDSMFQTSGNVFIQSGTGIDMTGSVYQSTNPWITSGSAQVSATDLDIRDLSSTSDSISVLQATQSNLKSEVYQGTSPWVVLGSQQITNSVLQVSGNVTISDDNYINVSSSGTQGIMTHDFTTEFIQYNDYEDKFQPVYLGLATPGTATSDAGWQIRKYNYSGTSPELVSSVLFGSGNTNFDKIWNARSGTGAAYS